MMLFMNQDPGRENLRIWRIALTGPLLDAHRHRLDEAERRRADAFKFDRDRIRFVLAHAAMRGLLSDVCGIAPQMLSLQPDDDGKPQLPADCGVHFNLSHSEDQALLAVWRGTAVGVDLEKIRRMADADDLALRHFSSRECAHLQSLPAGIERERAFFHCWTRKEAFVKCTGVGLRTDLTRIESGIEGDVLVDGVLIRTLPTVDEFAAAVAVRADAVGVEILDYRDVLN